MESISNEPGGYLRFRRLGTSVRASMRFRRILRHEHRLDIAEGTQLLRDLLVRMVQERDTTSLRTLSGVSGIAMLLKSTVGEGIDDSVEPGEHDLQWWRQMYGTNTFNPSEADPKSIVYTLKAFNNLTLKILLVYVVLNLAFAFKRKELSIAGATVAVRVFIVVLVRAWIDFDLPFHFTALNKLKKDVLPRVIRRGKVCQLKFPDLVVGDVVCLEPGIEIPADGLLLTTDGSSDVLSVVDELSGNEVQDVSEGNPFLLSGWKVKAGSGEMIVTAVGTRTEWFRLMNTTRKEAHESKDRLQSRLDQITSSICKYSILMEILVIVILIICLHYGKLKAGTPFDDVLDILEIAVTVFVVAIPEGILLAGPLAVWHSMSKMTKTGKLYLVRWLCACGTMSLNVTDICTDLIPISDEIKVTRVWVASKTREASKNPFLSKDFGFELARLLYDGICWCDHRSSNSEEDGELGNIECSAAVGKAILAWGKKATRISNSSTSFIRKISVKQIAGEAVKSRADENGECYVHWKGNANLVLNHCDHLLDAGGCKVRMTLSEKYRLLSEIHGMKTAARSRWIAFAYRKMVAESENETWAIPEDLILIAIVEIESKIEKSVKWCQAAGIRIHMVTGNNITKDNAIAIATEYGIFEHDGGTIAIEGSAFRAYEQEEKMREAQAPRISVMANASPEDRQLPVKTLEELDGVVFGGKTVPLKGFAAVTEAIQVGRSIYFHTQDLIALQLKMNCTALLIDLVAGITLRKQLPFTSVEFFWLNLIICMLAMTRKPPAHDDLKLCRRPTEVATKWRKFFPLPTNWRECVPLQSMDDIVSMIAIMFLGKQILGLDVTNVSLENTMIFNICVLNFLFEVITQKLGTPFRYDSYHNLRDLEGLLIIITLGLHVIMVQYILVMVDKSIVALKWNEWSTCLSFVFGNGMLPVVSTVNLLVST